MTGFLNLSHGIFERAALFFGVSYFFWGVLYFQPIVARLILLVPAYSALTPILVNVLVAALCVVMAFTVRDLRARTITKYALIFGVVLDTGVISQLTSLNTLGLVLHLLLLAGVFVSLKKKNPRIPYMLGGIVFAFSFLAIPACSQVQVCGQVEVSLTSPTGATLVVNGYKGFNVLLHNRTYYAIPQSEGIFNATKVSLGGYSQYYIGDSVAQVEQQIDSHVAAAPKLAVQGYRGYNIILFNGTYYAIQQSDGAFSVAKINSGGYSRYFIGNSVSEVEQMIDASPNVAPNPPTLAVQGYKGYNVIFYNNTYYAIQQSDGAFSVAKINSGGYSRYFIGNSVSEVEQMIDAKVGQ
jgi:hypothetical protein